MVYTECILWHYLKMSWIWHLWEQKPQPPTHEISVCFQMIVNLATYTQVTEDCIFSGRLSSMYIILFLINDRIHHQHEFPIFIFQTITNNYFWYKTNLLSISPHLHYSTSLPSGQIQQFPKTGICVSLIISLTSVISFGW